MYSVNFVGLNYFNTCTEGQKNVLVPNGLPDPKNHDHMPQHNASFFVEEDQVKSDNWWPDYKFTFPVKLEVKLGKFRTVNVVEFRIPKKVELDFRCDEKILYNVNLDEGLPKLQEVDGFELDSRPKTIANIPLPGGSLEVFRFGSAALVRWFVSKHQDPITITAFAAEERKRVTLTECDPQIPTEIVFSNTVNLRDLAESQGAGQHNIPKENEHDGGMTGGSMRDHMQDDVPISVADHAAHDVSENGVGLNGRDVHFAGMHASHGFAGHFVLYAKLDKARDESKFENPPLPDFMQLTPATFSHPYLAFISGMDEVPDGACVPSCCAKKG